MKKKYSEAFDSKLNRWVKPDDIDIADRYDKPRYYSVDTRQNENRNSGVILTYRKETKEIPFKRPDLHPDRTGYTRSSCFCEYCENNAEQREKVDRQVKAQESSVHKIAKNIAKDIKYIKIPAIKTQLLGQEYTISEEQIIKVKFLECEKKDEATGRIPDIIFEINYLGVVEKLYLEIFYKHPVEQDKKQEFRDNGINCLEVNISDLRSDTALSDKVLRKRIIEAIENDCYWISNAHKKIFDDTIDKYIADINSANKLKRSFEANPAHEERFFVFKDDYNEITGSHCTHGSRVRSTNIGDCIKCKRCLYINNVDSDDIRDVNIYCFKVEPRVNKVNFVKILNRIKEESLEKLRELVRE